MGSRFNAGIIGTKEWFIWVDSRQMGPYCLSDLKRNPSFNPDTFVWKRGFQEWKRARFVSELDDLFEDEPKPINPDDAKDISGRYRLKKLENKQDVDVLSLQRDPYESFLWIILILLIIFYALQEL